MAESAEIQIDDGVRSPPETCASCWRAAALRARRPVDPLPPVEAQRFRSVYVEDTFAPSYTKPVIEGCPPGKHVLGGGYFPRNGQGYLCIVAPMAPARA